MPTFTLNGFSASNGVFVGTTQFTITLPESYVFNYEYANSVNTPGFSTDDFEGAANPPIPEAFFPTTTRRSMSPPTARTRMTKPTFSA